MKRISVLLILLLAVVTGLQAAEQADEIMQAALNLNNTGDMAATVYMVLREKDGTTTTRKLEMYTKTTDTGSHSFVEFLSPADVKGTRFLSIGNKNGDDEQRLWLPELGKVRKIASSGKDGKFMGSDLTYYDMEEREFGDSVYTLHSGGKIVAVKDGKKQELDCHVIKTTPKDKDAPYSYTLTWVGKGDHFIYKSEMYGDKGEKVKTLYMTEVKTVNGVLVPIKTLVAGEDGHKTLMYMEELRIDSGLSDDIFTIKNLER